MILGVGSDLVAIERIRKIWQHFGHAFARKILSEAELSHIEALDDPTLFLAGRFAAKEALAKAFGTGMRDGLWFTQFSVVADELGKPVVSMMGQAKQQADRLGLKNCHLTLTHERDYALAFVVLEQ